MKNAIFAAKSSKLFNNSSITSNFPMQNLINFNLLVTLPIIKSIIN